MNNIIHVTQEVRELLHNLSEDERSRILIEELSRLSADKRAEVVALQSPYSLSMVLGGRFLVNSTFALQISSHPEELSRQIKDLSPEALAELIRVASDEITARIK